MQKGYILPAVVVVIAEVVEEIVGTVVAVVGAVVVGAVLNEVLAEGDTLVLPVVVPSDELALEVCVTVTRLME